MISNTFLKGLVGLLVAFHISCQSSGTKQTSGSGEVASIVTELEISHKLGQTTVPLKPARIVCIDIGALETLYSLGVTPVGVSEKFLPAYLKGLQDHPEVHDIGSVIEPDFEAISALSPDLILISTRQERFFDELSEIGPTVYVGTDNADYMASFVKNVNMLGLITGKEEIAKQKLDTLTAKIRKAQARYAQDPHKALFLIYNNGKFSAFGKGSRFGFIHDVLGLQPVMDLEDESVHGQKLSNELIAEANPDYLFIVDRNAAVLDKRANPAQVENRLIQQTQAYKNQKIFYLDPNVWFISGGGLVSVEMMVDDIMKLIP